ncbi:hypothetical protein [Rheinheimera sp. NSM]|uniref:hypothetical protein n=1 Tax=Rheinheimera sp. NSM TaxID=3457884 RepID=UPI0040370175
MIKKSFILFVAVIFSLTQPVLANEKETTSGRYYPEMNVVKIKERLSISSEQETKFSPVLEQHIKDRDNLFEKYGLDKESASISFRNLRSFRSEMLMLSDNTKEKLSDILTESQLKEWNAIQEESRREIRKGFSL